MNIAVVLAGGIGARVGGNLPKQLLPLADGKTILEHSVDAFEQAECIDEVCIVMHPDYIAEAEKMLQANGWTKMRHIIPGGKEAKSVGSRALMLYDYIKINLSLRNLPLPIFCCTMQHVHL